MDNYSSTIKNHTRITVTSKKTGETQVLLETKEEGNVVGDVLAGIPITESMDDSLDSLTFTIKEGRTKKLFKPFDIVTFTVDDGETVSEYEMCVLSDHAHTLSSKNGTFTHVVTVIESTKILEKTKIFNLNLTNPYDTLLRQLEKALANAEPVIRTLDENGNVLAINHECRFVISDEIRELLKNIPGEDFWFGNTDLRTVLDGILAPCNARVKVKKIDFKKLPDGTANVDKILIGYRKLSEVKTVEPVWTKDEQGEIVREELSNNGQDYAGKIVARGYNTHMDEPVTFSDTFKAEASTVTSDNAKAFFPYPISDKGIKKFAVNAEIIINFEVGYIDPITDMYHRMGITDWYNTILPVDISGHLLPVEQYELLSESEQKNYLPYAIGEDSFGVSGVASSFLWWTTDKMKTILGDEIQSQYMTPGTPGYEYLKDDAKKNAILNNEKIPENCQIQDGFGFDSSYFQGQWYNYTFKATFFSLTNTISLIDKPAYYDVDEIMMGIMDSQTENNLDVTRHGKKLESLIKRTGNDEYYIDVTARHYGKLLPLMSKIKMPEDNQGYSGGDYVLYKRECGVYDMFVKCRYYFSKDFNAVQKVAGINREKHLYDIPLESDECPITVNKYLVFSCQDNIRSVNISEYGNEIIKTALETITGGDGDKRVNYLLFGSYKNNESFPQDTENRDDNKPYSESDYVFMRPCLAYGQVNTISFIAGPMDNYSVGYSREGYIFSVWGDGGERISYNRYVSKERETAGECDKFKIQLAFDFTGRVSEDSVQKFPVAKRSLFVKASEYISEIIYYKDRTQKPVFHYSLTCVPSEMDYGTIFIGAAFCRDNALIKGGDNAGVKLVVSDSAAIDGSSEFVSEKYANYEYNVEDYFIIRNGQLFLINNITDDNVKSWAIVNNHRELLLGVNGRLQTIFVNISDYPK